MDTITKWKNEFENYYSTHQFDDGSHNLGHFRRVWDTAKGIIDNMDSKVDELTVLAAAYFHDIVSYPKNHPERKNSSKDAAIKTEHILKELSFPHDKIEDIKHCIESHSFSAQIKPLTIEAKVLQDADRMEALGAIGIARTFYVAGLMGSELFDENDPLGKQRELNDKKYALDHFQTKLLKLPETMQTEEGKKLAINRANVLNQFTDQLLSEL